MKFVDKSVKGAKIYKNGDWNGNITMVGGVLIYPTAVENNNQESLSAKVKVDFTSPAVSGSCQFNITNTATPVSGVSYEISQPNEGCQVLFGKFDAYHVNFNKSANTLYLVQQNI
jgi:hypothetical protein